MSPDSPTAEETVVVPTWTPPRWMNAMMNLLLHVPGLQSWIGRSTALLSWTGRRSGRRYTTPVSYYRSNGKVSVLTRPSRSWWRNFDEQPRVELRLAGETASGLARASVGDEATLPRLVEFLEHKSRDTKGYGVEIGADGKVDERDVRALLPQVVLVEIALDGEAVATTPGSER